MPSKITREVAEIAAAMQIKAMAFDSVHPGTPLGTWSAATYARAIIALVPEDERTLLGQLMAEASERAIQRLLPKLKPGHRIM